MIHRIDIAMGLRLPRLVDGKIQVLRFADGCTFLLLLISGR